MIFPNTISVPLKHYINNGARLSFELVGLTLESLADSIGLGAVVDERLLEPGVLQGLFGGDSVLRVVYEDLLQQVQE